MRLTMLRRGEVDVAWTPNNENQCGLRRTVPEVSKLWYEAVVEGDDKHLDEHGFIVDQFEIHRVIENTLSAPPVFLSCEMSARNACLNLWSAFGPAAQRPCVHHVQLTVGAIGPDGSKWAGITAELPDA